jgi:hypothetical protein
MPLLSSRPLVRRGDDKYFVANGHAVTTIRRALDDELNSVVTGAPGTGKTSLLAHVAMRAAADEREVYRVSLSAVADVANAAEGIAEAVAGPMAEREPPPWARSDEAILGRKHSRPTQRGRTQSAIWRLSDDLQTTATFDSEYQPEKGTPLIFVDALPRAVAATLFTEHADQLAEVPATWVVAISSDIEGPPTNPAPRFFDRHVHLGALGADDAAQIIASRTRLDTLAAANLLEGQQNLTAREVVMLARENSSEAGEGAKTRERRQQAERRLHEIGRPAAMLVSEMRSRGPVSASDENLLAAMGWKRARASEVLSALAKAKLVTSTEQAGPEGGRPRRMYELVQELK